MHNGETLIMIADEWRRNDAVQELLMADSPRNIGHYDSKVKYSDYDDDDDIPDIDDYAEDVKIVNVNITVSIEDSDRRLSARVNWIKPSNNSKELTLVYSRVSCNRDSNYEGCGEPEDSFEVRPKIHGEDVSLIPYLIYR